MKKSSEQEKPSNRPRISWPVVEGIEATAARLGCPLMLVKAVKKGGSKAFLTGNRVDTGILIPELFASLAKGSDLPDGIATPQDWLSTEKAKREAIKRQQDEKSVMPTVEAINHAVLAGGFFMSALERIARELPPALAGLPASGIAARLESETESIRRHLKIKLAKIGK